jgi:hypothetical protein
MNRKKPKIASQKTKQVKKLALDPEAGSHLPPGSPAEKTP